MPTSFAWVGPLLVGLLGVALALGGVWLMMRMMAKAGRRSAVVAYRRRLLAQHRKFGTDAYSRAVGRAAQQTPRRPKPAGESSETQASARLRRDMELLRDGK